jgi:hypothetical protein
MILTYTYGGINRSFSGRLRLSVIFDYPTKGNRSLARIIEVLLHYIYISELCKQMQLSVHKVRVCGIAAAAHIYLAVIMEPS